MGLIQLNMGKPVVAMTYINKALFINPTYAFAYVNRGIVKGSQQDYQGGINLQTPSSNCIQKRETIYSMLCITH